jgi:hypothetical protein
MKMNYFIWILLFLFSFHANGQDEGPGLMNSDSYHDAGYAGQGLKIAIIDGGYEKLAFAQSQGTAPAPANVYCWPYTCAELDANGNHGTKCVEAIYDHAPNATYYLLKPTSGASGYADLITYCIGQNVDIISISVLDLRDSWNDGTGVIGQELKRATDNGILVFIAGGNFKKVHWQGAFVNNNEGSYHEWWGNEMKNRFTATDTGRVEVYVIWDNPSGAIADWYDVELYEEVQGSGDVLIVTGDNAFGRFEKLYWNFQLAALDTMNLYIKVKRKIWTSDPPELEIYNFGHFVGPFSINIPEGSIGGTSSAQEPNVITVGAVPYSNYDTIPGANVVWHKSSLGPTNNGNLSPDVASVTGITVVSSSSRFWGTSCAAPNAAGAAAAFWSAHPGYSADGIRQVLLRKALLYNDWGNVGPDNTYGQGGLYLYDYHSNTEYVYFSGNNTGASTSKPWLSLEQADTYAPANSRVVMLGGTDDISNTIVLDKAMLYVSLKKDAITK